MKIKCYSEKNKADDLERLNNGESLKTDLFNYAQVIQDFLNVG